MRAFLFLLALLPLSATSQVYYLPKTSLQFHLLIEKTTYTPGDFARYAEKYLRLTGIQQEASIDHALVDCDLTTLGVRDTTKCFYVKLKGKAETAEIRLSDDGILQAINDEPPAVGSHPRFKPYPKKTAEDPRQLLSAEALAAGSIAKMAEITAQQIVELQEQRQQLMTGEADEQPQDEQQLQLMLNEIDHKRNLLLSLFTGTIRRDTTEHQITFCPEKEGIREVLFRISRQLGLVDSDDLSGRPYYLTLKNQQPANRPVPEDKKHENIFVNVPSMTELTLWQEDLQIATFQVPMAQFGFVDLRDGSLFKRYPTQLVLHPATGAVVKLHSDTLKK